MDNEEASYKPILEKDMEDQAGARPKSLLKAKSGGEKDGADEKMLSDEEKKVAPNSNLEIVDIKFSVNDKQNGDAKLDIGEAKRTFSGMTKEELMKYANDPFWVRLRWFLFIGFWVLWAAMLVGAILIIYSADKCEPPPPRTWWQEGPLTELPGDTDPERLKSLDKSVKGVIVSLPDDAYRKVDEAHNVIKLIRQAKDLGTKTIIELDPSTSDIWFEASENDLGGNYSDYYIWRDPKGTGDGAPLREQYPNNWINVDNKTSWKYSEKRKQFYYAPQEKPILNLRNVNVSARFKTAIADFFGEGVSGVRIRNAPYLLVDPKFEDETVSTKVGGYKLGEYGFYLHNKTENWPGLGALFSGWKGLVRNLTGDGLFMVKEELPTTYIDSYKVNRSLVVDLPVKTSILERTNVSEIVNRLNYTLIDVEWPLWKVNSSKAFPSDVLEIVTSLLPGASLIDSNSTLNSELLRIRESPSVMRGICDTHAVSNHTVFAFIRVTSGNPGFLVLLNAMNETATVNIRQDIPSLSSLEEVTIQLYSSNYKEADFLGKGEKKNAAKIPVSPKSVMVLSYVPPKKE